MTILKHVMVLGIVLTTSMAFAGSRRDAIRAASNLSETAEDMRDIARRYDYPRTEEYLRRIMRLADQAEDSARYESRQQVARRVNQIVRTYIEAKQYIRNIPSYRNQARIRRNMSSAINRLAYEVIGQNFVPVRRMAPGAEGQEAPEPTAQEIDQDDRALERAASAAPRGDWDEQDRGDDSDRPDEDNRPSNDDGGFDDERPSGNTAPNLDIDEDRE